MTDHEMTLREMADAGGWTFAGEAAIRAGADAIERLAALRDPHRLHVAILRGDLTLTEEQKRHLAGTDYRLEQAEQRLAALEAALDWLTEYPGNCALHVDETGYWIETNADVSHPTAHEALLDAHKAATQPKPEEAPRG